MPKYEYACKSCGEHLEAVQSFTDAPLTECPACGGPLRKVFSPPAITFKGSGFYRTDNRSSRSEPKADTKADGSTDGKTDAKTDGKTDGKAEPAKTDGGPAAGSRSNPTPPKTAEAKTA
ncbi:MAG: FmdB family transcriptional regulator [Actinomycetota bacterium]|nr:FmdB family transcriptional regulator [Actinomycetota bacterium]